MDKASVTLRGIGSVMNISPGTNYSVRFRDTMVRDGLRRSWNKTGEYLSKAIDTYDNEQQAKKK